MLVFGDFVYRFEFSSAVFGVVVEFRGGDLVYCCE